MIGLIFVIWNLWYCFYACVCILILFFLGEKNLLSFLAFEACFLNQKTLSMQLLFRESQASSASPSRAECSAIWEKPTHPVAKKQSKTSLQLHRRNPTTHLLAPSTPKGPLIDLPPERLDHIHPLLTFFPTFIAINTESIVHFLQTLKFTHRNPVS